MRIDPIHPVVAAATILARDATARQHMQRLQRRRHR
jgi:hypothetical protein